MASQILKKMIFLWQPKHLSSSTLRLRAFMTMPKIRWFSAKERPKSFTMASCPVSKTTSSNRGARKTQSFPSAPKPERGRSILRSRDWLQTWPHRSMESRRPISMKISISMRTRRRRLSTRKTTLPILSWHMAWTSRAKWCLSLNHTLGRRLRDTRVTWHKWLYRVYLGLSYLKMRETMISRASHRNSLSFHRMRQSYRGPYLTSKK